MEAWGHRRRMARQAVVPERWDRVLLCENDLPLRSLSRLSGGSSTVASSHHPASLKADLCRRSPEPAFSVEGIHEATSVQRYIPGVRCRFAVFSYHLALRVNPETVHSLKSWLMPSGRLPS